MTTFRSWPTLGLTAALLIGLVAWQGWPRQETVNAQQAPAPVATTEAAVIEKPAIRRPEGGAPAPTPTVPVPAPSVAKVPPAPVGPPAEEVGPGGIPASMSGLFPIGRVFEGVRIPSYTGDTLTSVVNSEYMKRADEEHLEMETLEIVVYQAGKADTRILTDRAIFDIATKVLRSTTSARIVQDQFEMKGDRLHFDSASGIGHLTGNVKTLVHDIEKFQGGGGRDSDSDAGSAPPTPEPETKAIP